MSHKLVMLPTDERSRVVLTDGKLRITPYAGNAYQAQVLYIVLEQNKEVVVASSNKKLTAHSWIDIDKISWIIDYFNGNGGILPEVNVEFKYDKSLDLNNINYKGIITDKNGAVIIKQTS